MTQKPDTHPPYTGPAFPRVGAMPAMSLRDYFAGQVINGMYADNSQYRQNLNFQQAAKNAYFMADAMIATRDAK